MLFDLLHFGSGSQAIHYFLFCFVAILGTIQSVAAHYHRRDLLWLEGRGSYVLGALMVGGSFAWFFLTDDEIFIPGLAGGELFTLFMAALIAAVPATRIVAHIQSGARAFAAQPKRATREKEPTL